jgi:hypothetical protein
LSSEEILEATVVEVCRAIRRHAGICRDEPENVGAVVRAGEALIRAVLDYEVALRAVSGWSNPIRHLGPLPLFEDRLVHGGADEAVAQSVQKSSAAIMRLDLAARYQLSIPDDDALVAFASGRFGAEVSDVTEAIKVLFEAESWDPERYPPGLISVEDVGVEISIDRAE